MEDVVICWRKKPRWIVVIVGQESGNVTELPFLACVREEDAKAWVDRLNSESWDKDLGLTVYDYREVPR